MRNVKLLRFNGVYINFYCLELCYSRNLNTAVLIRCTTKNPVNSRNKATVIAGVHYKFPSVVKSSNWCKFLGYFKEALCCHKCSALLNVYSFQKKHTMSSPSAGKRRMDTDVIKLYPF